MALLVQLTAAIDAAQDIMALQDVARVAYIKRTQMVRADKITLRAQYNRAVNRLKEGEQ